MDLVAIRSTDVLSYVFFLPEGCMTKQEFRVIMRMILRGVCWLRQIEGEAPVSKVFRLKANFYFSRCSVTFLFESYFSSLYFLLLLFVYLFFFCSCPLHFLLAKRKYPWPQTACTSHTFGIYFLIPCNKSPPPYHYKK